MKRFLNLLMLISLAVCVALALVACDGNDGSAGGESSSSSVADSTGKDSGTDNSGSQAGSTDTQSSSDTQGSTDSGNTDDNGEPTTIKYVVRAVDAFGEALDAIINIEVYKDGELVGEAPLRRGSAAFMLEAGEYTYKAVAMDCELFYNEASCILTEEEHESTVVLYEHADETTKREIFIYDNTTLDHVPYNAVQVGEGATYVKIDRPENTYFLFTPTRGGIYKISYESDKKLTIGYFGSPHNVLTASPVEVVDGAFELEVKNDGVNLDNPGGTTQIVIGIRSFIVEGCILKIERIGNPTVEMPWTDVSIDKNVTKQDNYINSEFVDFDVTDKNLTVVFNENDGYYHLNKADGPVIFIRISSAVIESSTSEETIYAYLPSFITMCDTDRLCKVFYDEEGNVVKKESYNELLKAYAALCGNGGMYPLNKQLAEVVKNIGEHKGWYDLGGISQIFGDEAHKVIAENAWLFACAYENQKALGTSEKPIVVEADSADSAKINALLLENGTEVVLRTATKATIKINNAQGVKIVTGDGVEHTPDAETGAISAVVEANQNFTVVYEGEETVVYFTLTVNVQ